MRKTDPMDTSTDRPRAVLFDVDGTLVDTTYVHTIAWWQALREHGHLVPMAPIHRAIGLGSDKILDHLLGDHDNGQDDAITASHATLVAAWYQRFTPLPGARDLLKRCHDEGLTVVLSTSADQRDHDALRDALDAEAWIDEATTSEDADQSKPAPDILTAALERIGVRAQEAVFVGDAVWDVQAATRIGMPCIGLECGGTSAAELRDAGAVAVWSDPADLLAHWSQSPLHDRTPA